ncbi:CU044_5270 family protein [Cellulomonas sp. URHD0024]|uniref:CU044_5270 family protein n=1 Tax=Cellulomonas sp. URHD0024 TaxID=1302620 RepID=UPI00040D39D1|nr:CU044_5270 family protein [Cellulomonas sp. URHD0024]
MNTTLEDRLVAIGPNGSPDPDALAAAYAELRTAMELPRVEGATVLRRRRGRRIGLTVLVGAAAAVALVAIPVLSTGGRTPISTASAAELLVRAGQAAGEQPDVSRDAAYWHSVQISDSRSDVTGETQRGRLEIWSGHHEPTVWIDVASTEPTVTGPATFGPGITWDEMFTLPTEPVALELALRSYTDPDQPDRVEDQTLWGSVEELLVNSPASPALRQALWEVAAQIPGTTVGANITDSTGRPGVLVARPSERVIVDPVTGRLLERVRDVSADRPPYRDTFVDQGPTDTAPHVPYPDLPAGCTLDEHCDVSVDPLGRN